MDIKLIKAPSPATLDIIQNRSKLKFDKSPGAMGLVQGKMIEMTVACDIAYKTSGVEVSDVRGSCPQNMVMLAIVGDMEEVKVALRNIEEKSKEKDIW
ncbi:BMC domain-containing protein [Anaerococcus sp. AGMB00486]|uniref:BMC domain-containing protein n=2 Tax=Anaerococcus TaxID=165779 RepID=A0ABX2N9Z7_9FIRM|nr:MULTISPECIES: BMC domain-containing protein [Anaerococcus]MDY3007280.1 BMC domain-containing protein [Anaerococcus porci]MSS77661.1 BMC domain-containing protein [Anaerococcus porci]NVF11516.1 BMC domain-containing protein [Anaerococcus faecalis]